jgi:HAD superfamily hydrolase (TIGR01549 family)
MSGIKHIIFDFDGTLANTWPVIIHGCVNVFQKHDNRELTVADIHAMAGPTELKIIEKYLINQAMAATAVEEFVTDYENHHEAMVERDEAILNLLRNLQQSGVGLALFTGKSRRTLEISLSKLGWDIVFDKIVSGDDVQNSKPSPEGIFHILEALNWDRKDTVFVGDSNDDMQAGREAEVRTFAAQWMSMAQDSHYRIQPERTFDNLPDFYTFIKEHIV